MARMSSGSRRSASGVEPVISANITVTTRLSSGGGSNVSLGRELLSSFVVVSISACPNPFVPVLLLLFASNAVPHSIQNFAIGRLIVPQFAQMMRRFPHSRQNFALVGLSV